MVLEAYIGSLYSVAACWRHWCDGRRGLKLERQTLYAASTATEQPFIGTTLLTSHEEGPKKGGPNTVC